MSRLTVTAAGSASVAVLEVAGSLDAQGAARLRRAVFGCLARQPRALVIDLARAEVLDEVSVTVLTALARHAAAWPGTGVLVYSPAGRTADALERMAVPRAVPVYTDRDAALAEAAAMPAPPRVRTAVEPSPLAGRVARAVVAAACRQWGMAGLIDNAELVVTELIANAVTHARPPIELGVGPQGRYLHLAVRDGSTTRPRRVLAEPGGEYGRGLLIVEALSARWGSHPTGDGKVVWATLTT